MQGHVKYKSHNDTVKDQESEEKIGKISSNSTCVQKKKKSKILWHHV